MMYSVLWAMQGRAVLIARKEASQVRRSVWSEVLKAMRRMGLEDYFDIQISTFTMVSKIGNGSIQFTGVDDPEKLKSITPPKATAIDTVIMEESDAFTEDDFTQLRIRQRGTSDFPKKIIVIFNPVSIAKMKWLWDLYFEPNGWDDETDMVFENDEVYIQRVNYDLNTYLTEDDIAKMLRIKETNPRKYRVFGEGRFGASGKTVFDPNSYEKTELDTMDLVNKALDIEDNGFELRLGVDFGFVHKSAFSINVWDRVNSVIYIVGLVYKSELTKDTFANLIVREMRKFKIPMSNTIYCDSAEPSSIKTLIEAGLTGAKSAKKGSGSVMAQIDFLQDHYIYVDNSCNSMYEEMTGLTFKKRADGTYREELDDITSSDDAIASLRYAFSLEAYYRNTGSIYGYDESF